LVQKTTKLGVRAKASDSKPTQTWRAGVSRAATIGLPARETIGVHPSPGGFAEITFGSVIVLTSTLAVIGCAVAIICAGGETEDGPAAMITPASPAAAAMATMPAPLPAGRA